MTGRIILVDDHPTVLAGLQALLHGLPEFTLVGKATTGGHALTLVKEHSPDIVVLDMGLPGMNGLALAKRILEQASKIQIVMLTHYEDLALVQKALGIGIRGYVLKSSAEDKIAQAIRTVQSGGVYIDAELEEFRSEWVRRLAHPSGPRPVSALTSRELQVLRLVAIGHSNKDIARRINLSIKSVETYKFRACKKLSLHSRLDIIRYGASHGWILDQ